MVLKLGSIIVLYLLVFTNLNIFSDFKNYWLHKVSENENDEYSVWYASLIISMVVISLFALFGDMAGKDKLKADFKPTEVGVILLFVLALVEEVVFRGFPILLAKVLNKLLRSTKFLIIMGYISSIIFGVVHLDNYDSTTIFIVIPYAAFGFGLYWIARRYGFLYSVIVHFLYNFVVLGMAKITA